MLSVRGQPVTEEEKDARAARRHYNLGLVTRRYSRLMRILSPLIMMDESEIHWEPVLHELARAISPSAVGDALASERNGFASLRACKHLPWSARQFIAAGAPFIETPEESRAEGADLSGPIRESFGLRAGGRMTAEEIRRLSWRLAGNTHKLAMGKAVPPWSPDFQSAEWCLARVSDVVGSDTFEGESGFRLTYFFYTGAPAGLELSRVYRAGSEARFANDLGIPWKEAKRTYPQELVNMLGYVRLEPGRSKSRMPVFRGTEVSVSHAEHNRELREARLDPARCPYGFKPEQYLSCVECVLVYGDIGSDGTGLRCEFSMRRGDDGCAKNTPDAATW